MLKSDIIHGVKKGEEEARSIGIKVRITPINSKVATTGLILFVYLDLTLDPKKKRARKP